MMLVTTMVNQRPVKVPMYVSGGKRRVLKLEGDRKVYVRRARTRDAGEQIELLPGVHWEFYARCHVGSIVYYGHGNTIEDAVTSLFRCAKASNVWLDSMVRDDEPEPERVVITVPMVLRGWAVGLWDRIRK